MKNSYYIGIDIGGTKILAALVSKDGKVLESKKHSVKPGSKSEDIYEELKELIEKLLSSEDLFKKHILGIGCGVPGLIAPDHQKILVTPNINLAGFDLVGHLSKDFDCHVVLGNDVNLGVLGEQWLGAGKGYKNLIGISPGTGVGGAIVINGELYTGSQGAGGELGHMIIDHNSDKQSAGVYGSLEALASRKAMARDIRTAIEADEPSLVVELTEGDLTQIKSKIFAAALKEHDPVVVRVVEQACHVLGKACISLRHVFNPDRIIFGGGVIEACEKFMLPIIRKVSDADPFFKGVDSCDIVAAELGDDAVLLGAIALYRQVYSK